MEQKKELKKKHPLNERHERVKHLYNTMQRSLQRKKEEKRLNNLSKLTDSCWIIALVAIPVLLFLLWKF